MYPSIPEKNELSNYIMNAIKSQWHGGGRQKSFVIQELARVLKQSNKQKYFPQIMNHYIGTFNVRGNFEVQKLE